MDNIQDYPVIIVGAGPAGLTLAYHLKKLGIDPLIVEKGESIGESWTKMPDHLHLISQWHSNFLVKDDSSLSPANKAHTAMEFAQYLSDFSHKHHLEIKTQTNVVEILKEHSRFVLRTPDGELRCSVVADCRGHFSFPWMPEYSIEGKAPLMIHFNDFRSGKQFADMKRICLVGKRLSAGQIITELIESDPKKEIILATRSKVHFSPPMFILNLLLKYLAVFEWLPLKFKIKKSADIPMHSSVKKYFAKNVKVKGNILKIKNNELVFEDETIPVDAIIFATGYKREKVNLRDEFESASDDNYFYLGLNSQRTFTSRFLRGIREDAPILAKLIVGRVAPRNNCQ
jgi:putative flavoprotein involved in K+ transport